MEETTGAVSGFADTAFTAVRDVFERDRHQLGAGGGAFSMYVEGDLVVDLWSGTAGPGRAWAVDTLAPLFAATKGLVATCAMVLHSRGLLDVDQRVARYWPEFGAAGKAAITVRQVLNHTSGVIEIPGYADLVDINGDGWDSHDEIQRRIAASAPAWAPGTTHGYQVTTFGYLVGALVERIDGRPLAQFFREEVSEPLGIDVWLNVPDRVAYRAAIATMPPAADAPPDDPLEIIAGPARDESSSLGRSFIAAAGSSLVDRLADLGNNRFQHQSGSGSYDGLGTARGLARLYAALGEGGTLDGAAIASPESIERFSRLERAGFDRILSLDMSWCLGFQGNEPILGHRAMGPNPAAFGHQGAGGQLGFCDRRHRVAVGFTRNELSLHSPLQASLIEAAYAALGVAPEPDPLTGTLG